jgi:hypothetical protein
MTGPSPEPGFYCPISSPPYPHRDSLVASTLEWARDVRLCGDDTKHTENFALAGAHGTADFYPRGSTVQRMQTLGRFHAWILAVDDRSEDSPDSERLHWLAETLPRFARILEVPDVGRRSREHFDRALGDIAASLHRWASPGQSRRFTESLRTWALGCVWEAAAWDRGIPPSLADYLPMRYATGGGTATAAAAIAVMRDGEELPDATVDSPPVRAVSEAAVLTLLLDNDRYSRAKTLQRHGKEIDIIDVIQHATPGCSDAEAVTRAVALRDRIMTLYLRLREQLRPSAGPELGRYLLALDDLIKGNLDWGRSFVRYITPDRVLPPDVDKPSDPSTEPPDIPAIAWWWDHVASHPRTEAARSR